MPRHGEQRSECFRLTSQGLASKPLVPRSVEPEGMWGQRRPLMAGRGNSITGGFSEAVALNPINSCSPATHQKPRGHALCRPENPYQRRQESNGAFMSLFSPTWARRAHRRGAGGGQLRQGLKPGFTPSLMLRIDSVLAVIWSCLSGLANGPYLLGSGLSCLETRGVGQLCRK